MVVKFDWPRTATLEDVEKFRRRYASNYDLQTCAMMLNSIGTGSFTVTWFVPVSVVEMLRKKRALAVFKEFSVTRLDIHTSTQTCVYQIPPQRPVAPSSTSDSSAIAKSNAANKSKEPGQVSSVDEDYPFVEEPSDDFFCPVTTGVLLHPHLTSCCGNHLSEEAASRIQRDGGACPLCKKKDWSTVLNKHLPASSELAACVLSPRGQGVWLAGRAGCLSQSRGVLSQ
ncbi:hypothetical protein GBAR_LOCUS12429 [Geodia barretti]|uniref:Uncharacterized protein n=1 Tax=Geodia barretti TaxID=519541 RepID=A0AA35RZV7_GEOBA|nr:hypothetical protein GBAR_LOCUS12429 [Geodia barretti]